MPEFLREMRRGEEEAVAALLTRAYGGGGPAQMVADLRRTGGMAGEMVLPYQGDVVGYYAVSRALAPAGWVVLGPVAIDPDWQGRGHGRRMIGQLAVWAGMTGQGVVVDGLPAFFARAGFEALSDTAEARALSFVTGQGGKGAKPSDLAAGVVFPKAFGR